MTSVCYLKVYKTISSKPNVSIRYNSFELSRTIIVRRSLIIDSPQTRTLSNSHRHIADFIMICICL